LAVCATNARAQTPNIPSTAETGRIQKQIFIPSINQQGDIIPPSSVDLDKNIPRAEEGFLLENIKIEGITAFPQNHFNSLIQEYIGLKVDLNTLNQLSARITNMYREAGYFISRSIVPQQEVIDGQVTIIVIEGGINQVDVQDSLGILEKDSYCILYRTAAKMKKLSPLHGPTMERYVLLLNDHQGISVNSTLSAPQSPESAPGKVDLILEINEKKPTKIISLNNFGSRFVGPYQINGAYYDGGIFNSFDSLSINVTSSLPVDEVQFISANYTIPLSPEGLKASYTLSYSNSAPGQSLRDLEVKGRSINGKAELSYPIIRSRRKDLHVGSSLEFRQSSTEFLGTELIDDKTRSLTLFTRYKGLDEFGGDINALASISTGFNILGATETGSDKLSRTQGRSDFFKVNVDASRKTIIKQNLELETSVSGQYAPHPLLSAQEFGYGGVSYGRAYDPSEITGDTGISTSSELRYTNIPSISKANLKLVPFAYYDIGKVWNKDRGAKPRSAASAGLGTYFSINPNIGGSLQVAFPLTKSIDNPIINGENGPRILLNLSAQF